MVIQPLVRASIYAAPRPASSGAQSEDRGEGPLESVQLGQHTPPPALQLFRNPSVEHVGEMLTELYHRAGPRIGAKLVEPPFVLMLAQERGENPWNGAIPNPVPEDLQRFEQLNGYLKPRGFAIEVKPEDYLERGIFNMVSLVGLENVTRNTHLEWVQPFSADGGWEGYDAWKTAMAPYRGNDPKSHAAWGVMLGYPDRAIEHMILNGEYDRRTDMVSTQIPGSQYYETGQPNFQLGTRDIRHPEIVATIQRWGSILTGVYASPAHQALERDPGFQAARAAYRAGEDARLGSAPYWTEERERYGLVGPERRLLEQAGTVGHERVLQANVDSLCLGVVAGLSLAQLAARLEPEEGDRVSFTRRTLEDWLSSGSQRPGSPANRFYTTVEAYRPELLDELTRERLEPVLSNPNFKDPRILRHNLRDGLVRQRFQFLEPEFRARVCEAAATVLPGEELAWMTAG
ncbi:MAG: hypothetical protein AB1758_31620 [Candidatus Eremiobacterota bacterium]